MTATTALATVNVAPLGYLQQLIDAGELAEYERICAEEREAETLYWQEQRRADAQDREAAIELQELRDDMEDREFWARGAW